MRKTMLPHCRPKPVLTLAAVNSCESFKVKAAVQDDSSDTAEYFLLRPELANTYGYSHVTESKEKLLCLAN